MRTQTTLLLYIFAALMTLTACQNKEAQELTEENYQKLRSINESLSDVSAAVDLAFGSKIAPSGSIEKVRKMADLIRASNCKARSAKDEEPSGEDRYNVDWINEGGVQEGGTCVVGLNRNTAYNANKRTLTHVEDFKAWGDFQKESLVHSYFIQGSLDAKTENTLTTVNGKFDSKNFRVDKLGPVWVTIRTKHSIRGEAFGSGTANLTFQAKDMKYTASVAWSGKNTITYRINGKKVDEKTIQELFSAYGLMEIVDRSARMR